MRRLSVLFLALILPILGQIKNRNWELRSVLAYGQMLDGHTFWATGSFGCNQAGTWCAGRLAFEHGAYGAFYRIPLDGTPPQKIFDDGNGVGYDGEHYVMNNGVIIASLNHPVPGYYRIELDNSIAPVLVAGQTVDGAGQVNQAVNAALTADESLLLTFTAGGKVGNALYHDGVLRLLSLAGFGDETFIGGGGYGQLAYGYGQIMSKTDNSQTKIPAVIDLNSGKIADLPPPPAENYLMGLTNAPSAPAKNFGFGNRSVAVTASGGLFLGTTAQPQTGFDAWTTGLFFCQPAAGCRNVVLGSVPGFPSAPLWEQTEISGNLRGEFAFETPELSPDVPYPAAGLARINKNIFFGKILADGTAAIEPLALYGDQLFGYDRSTPGLPGYNENRFPYVTDDGRVIFVHNTYGGSTIVVATRLNPAIADKGIVEGAFAKPAMIAAPGQIMALFGNGLATGTLQAADPLPTRLLGSQVLIDGFAAPMYFASPQQINFQMPEWVLPGSVVQVNIQNGDLASFPVPVTIQATNLAVFKTHGQWAVIRQDGSLVSGDQPPQPGETISIFGSGAGLKIDRGGLRYCSQSVAVVIDGQPAISQFCGEAPGFPGLDQINVLIPLSFRSGTSVGMKMTNNVSSFDLVLAPAQ